MASRNKPKTKAYYEQRVDSLLKKWPGLGKANLRDLSKQNCLDWAAKYEGSATAFNTRFWFSAPSWTSPSKVASFRSRTGASFQIFERLRRDDWKKVDDILARVPANPPIPGDEAD